MHQLQSMKQQALPCAAAEWFTSRSTANSTVACANASKSAQREEGTRASELAHLRAGHTVLRVGRGRGPKGRVRVSQLLVQLRLQGDRAALCARIQARSAQSRRHRARQKQRTSADLDVDNDARAVGRNRGQRRIGRRVVRHARNIEPSRASRRGPHRGRSASRRGASVRSTASRAVPRASRVGRLRSASRRSARVAVRRIRRTSRGTAFNNKQAMRTLGRQPRQAHLLHERTVQSWGETPMALATSCSKPSTNAELDMVQLAASALGTSRISVAVAQICGG